jgi:hypothetical protein
LAKPFVITSRVGIDDKTLSFTDLNLSIEDAQLGAALELSLAPLAAQGNFSITATAPNLENLTPRFEDYTHATAVPMNLHARGRWADPIWVFDDFLLQLGNGALRATGGVTGPPNFGQTDLEVDWQISSMSHFNIFTGFDWPDEQAHLKFRLSGTHGKLDLDHLVATVGRSDVEGDFRLRSGVPMTLEANFRSKRLDITDYLPGPPPIPEVEKPAKPAPTPTNGRVIPDTAVDLRPLRKLDATFDMEIDELLIPSGFLHDVVLVGSIDSGGLSLDQFSLRGVSDGSMRGILELKPADNGARFTTNFTGTGLSVGIFSETVDDRKLLPRYDFDASIDMSGSTIREMAGSLDGEIRFVAGEGRVRATALRYFTGDLVSALVTILNPFAETDPYIDVECAVILLDAHNGLLKGTPAYVLESEKVNVLSDVEIDLKTEEIKIQVKTIAQKGLGISITDIINPYAQLTGTLADPDVSLDPKGTIIEGGAAVVTAGLSMLATRLAERLFLSRNQCRKALEDADEE